MHSFPLYANDMPRLGRADEIGIGHVQSPHYQGVHRTLDLLDVLARGPTGVGEAARILMVNKSTASRLLSTMASRGYAVKYPDGFRLGPKVTEIHDAYIASYRVTRGAHGLIDRLARATSETVLLTSYEAGVAVYIDKVESAQPLRTSSRIGSRAPLHAGAAGKAILAGLPAELQEEFIRSESLDHTGPLAITDPQKLRTELEAIRSRGYAVSREEINEGIAGLGIALLDSSQRPIGAISVTGPVTRFNDSILANADVIVSIVAEWYPDGVRRPK